MALTDRITSAFQAVGADIKSIFTAINTKLTRTNNLSDLTNAATARGNLGLGNVGNVSPADLRNRATHTGMQPISSITGLQDALDAPLTASKIPAKLITGPMLADQTLTEAQMASNTVNERVIQAQAILDTHLKQGQKTWHIVNDTVSVKMYGATGNGTTDDTASINACIQANPGKRIHFPAGTYRTVGSIVVPHNNMWLEGDGEGVTWIANDHATNSIIVVGSATAMRDNVRISSMLIGARQGRTKTAGACIRVENSHNIRIDHIRFGYGVWNNVEFLGGPQQFLYYLSDFEINDGQQGIIIDGYAQDVWIRSGIIAATRGPGLVTFHASGVYVDSIDMLQCYNGVQLSPGPGQESRLMWFNQVIADTCSANGWELTTAAGGTIFGINLSNCWGSSSTGTGTGFITNGTAAQGGMIRGINLTNFRAMSNGGHGIELKYGTGIDFVNTQACQNSQSQDNLYSGIYVNPGVTDFSFIGGTSGLNAGHLAAGQQRQRHGIVIDANCQRWKVIGMNLMGNRTSGLLWGGGTDRGEIAYCNGYITERLGSATFPGGGGTLLNGNTRYITINHGIGYAPLLEELMVWGLTPFRDSLITHWAITNITATSFRLNVQGSWATNGAPALETYWGWRYQRSRGLNQ